VKKVSILGAGGKMGRRVSKKLNDAGKYDLEFIEISQEGKNRLKGLGIDKFTPYEEAIPVSDVVILAIPDILIRKISKDIIPLMKSDSMVIGLDPAAAYAEVIPLKDNVGYFVAHPHHPYLFNNELDINALDDHFGGVAKQDISCSLYHGEEKFYALGEELARIFYGPVNKVFRVTVQQMAFCEPGLVESVCCSLVYALKQAYDKTVNDLGVPEDVAYSFLMGHLHVELAITFGLVDAKYSDGAIKAMNDAMKIMFKEGWLDIMLSKDFILESVAKITGKMN
jgi:hypothetical protein